MSTAHWVALTTQAGVGGKSITRLLRHFGSLEAVLTAAPDEIQQVRHIGPKIAAALARIDLPAAEAEVARFAAQGVQTVTWEDRDYPANLLLSEHAPPVLFVRGALDPAADPHAVAVVGTRTPTRDSAALAQRIAHELVARGWTIVSGLALGVDTAAHRGALEAGGRTLAVLGCGVSAVYPRQNVALAGEIEHCGAVLCEVHPEAQVSKQALIARNRITSGLSRAVIVVQSGEDGGSMVTAHRARAQHREVFAVTGGGSGCEALLKSGAVALDPDALDFDALAARLDAIVITPPEPPHESDQPRLL